MRQLCAVLGHYRRHPWLWALAWVLPFILFPEMDLAVSRWFYRAGDGFFLKTQGVFVFVLKGLPPILIGLAVSILILAMIGWIRRKSIFGVTGSIAAYLLLCLIVGPGLIVNALFKDHWGRARPSQIAEFGGAADFTPPLLIANQCTSNCSFSSGHAALGFWLFALALLAPDRHRPLAVAAALAFGLFVGISRIAQGGHFLSDVLASGAVVVAVALTLHRLLLRDGADKVKLGR